MPEEKPTLREQIALSLLIWRLARATARGDFEEYAAQLRRKPAHQDLQREVQFQQWRRITP